MNQRTNNSRWFCQSDTAKSKPPRYFVQAILGNCENQQTFDLKVLSNGSKPTEHGEGGNANGTYNLYGGQSQRVSDRGGEINAG